MLILLSELHHSFRNVCPLSGLLSHFLYQYDTAFIRDSSLLPSNHGPPLDLLLTILHSLESRYLVLKVSLVAKLGGYLKRWK